MVGVSDERLCLLIDCLSFVDKDQMSENSYLMEMELFLGIIYDHRLLACECSISLWC